VVTILHVKKRPTGHAIAIAMTEETTIRCEESTSDNQVHRLYECDTNVKKNRSKQISSTHELEKNTVIIQNQNKRLSLYCNLQRGVLKTSASTSPQTTSVKTHLAACNSSCRSCVLQAVLQAEEAECENRLSISSPLICQLLSEILIEKHWFVE
jgi:hypothetical protein